MTLPIKLLIIPATMLALACCVLADPPKSGITQSTTSDSKITPMAGGSVGTVTLADEPFHLDQVGLSVRVPVGCQITSNRVGGKTTAEIVAVDPKSNTANWLMDIQTPQTTNEKATIQQAMDETVSLLRASYSVVDKDQQNYFDKLTQAKILEQTPDLKLLGGAAGRLYFSTPREDKTRLVKGYTIFKPQPHQYVVFEFICHENDFPTLRGIYETIVGTAQFAKSDAVMAERGAAIKAGAALFQKLTEKDYLDAMGEKELWYRYYQPSGTGAPMDDKELGYRGAKFWRGKRGEISPSKPRSSWTKADDQDGFLARNRARLLWNGQIVDTMALYFMTPDRSEESWTITTSVKDGNGHEQSTATETGARVKDDIRIVETAMKGGATTLHPPIMGEGYISMFETVLLPRLLARHKELGEMGFYCWQTRGLSEPGTISFRKDVLATQGGSLVLTSTLRDDMSPQTSYFNDQFELVRVEAQDNTVWAPMELDALKRLWQQKGLPVDH